MLAHSTDRLLPLSPLPGEGGEAKGIGGRDLAVNEVSKTQILALEMKGKEPEQAGQEVAASRVRLRVWRVSKVVLFWLLRCQWVWGKEHWALGALGQTL